MPDVKKLTNEQLQKIASNAGSIRRRTSDMDSPLLFSVLNVFPGLTAELARLREVEQCAKDFISATNDTNWANPGKNRMSPRELVFLAKLRKLTGEK